MGMRGKWATPFVSLSRPPRKPLPTRVCPRCEQVFKPKRRDAIFCSSRCRQAVFYKRHLADMEVDDRPVFTLLLKPEKGIDGPMAVKSLLKTAATKFGLRIVKPEAQPKDAA